MEDRPFNGERRQRLLHLHLQHQLRALHDRLTRTREYVARFATLEDTRPLSADERTTLRRLRLETRHLQHDLARLRTEFKRLRS